MRKAATKKWLAWFLCFLIAFGNVVFVKPSITTAAQPSSLDEVSSYLYGFGINDSRSRRLIEVLQPDLVYRGVFEWIGTQFSDRDWSGGKASINELQNNGSLVFGGVSGRWWAPDAESGPAKASQATMDEATIQDDLATGLYRQLNLNNQIALDQLIYKAKKHIDAGVDGIEFDEYGDQLGDRGDPIIQSSFAYIRDTLKAYAMNTYGRTLFVGANAPFAGGNYPTLYDGVYDGTEPVDYYIRVMPFKLTDGTADPWSYASFDGTYNGIPHMRVMHESVAPKRFFYYVDWANNLYYLAPKIKEEWPNYYRITTAQVLAAGGTPGYFRGFYNNLDALDQGIFQEVANLTKFMRENDVLWKNLTFIEPDVDISANNIYTSAFEQQDRTILHLVNGNYNNDEQVMNTQSNFTVSIALSAEPTRIWMTTPDKPSSSRKSQLAFTYEDGIATITVPELEVHNVIVIEEGTPYNPSYGPLDIVFPFPIQQQLPVLNKIKPVTVATDGLDDTFEWYVNGVAGGNSILGTVSADGEYTAPAQVPSPSTVTVTAVSRIDPARSNSYTLEITPSSSLPWSVDFSGDTVGDMPSQLYIVDGRGDWRTSLDGSQKVLDNYNITEGYGDSAKNELAQYSPFTVSGDQTWTDYEFNVSVKLQSDPVYFYSIKSGTAVALVFRYQDAKNYYQYTLDANNKAQLFKVTDGEFKEIGEAVDADFVNTSAYTNITIKVFEDNFQLLMDSALVREDKDVGSELLSGGVGLKSSFIEGFYKDISVEAVEPFSVDDPDVFRDKANDFSKVYDHSGDLKIDSSNPAFLGGDEGRFARTVYPTEAWISYELGDHYNLKATAYFWDEEAFSHFKFFVSDDHQTWTEFEPRIDVAPKEEDAWYKVVYTKNSFASSAKYLKIQWQGGTGYAFTPQLGEVVIQKKKTEPPAEPVVDDMLDFSGVFEKSTHIGIDPSNATMLGDDSRFFREWPGSPDEWVTYELQGKKHALVTAAFWDEQPIDHFKFYTSTNNVSWTEVAPTIHTELSTQPTYWHHVAYYLNDLPEQAQFLKIKWGNLSGPTWTPQLKKVVLYNNGSTISPTSFSFDKYAEAAAHTDAEIAMALNGGDTLSGIANGTTPLTSGTDYSVSGSTVTIKKAYLAAQPIGTTTLTFTFGSGQTQTLTITITETTAPTATLTSTASGAVNGAFPITVTFSEPVDGFTANGLTVSNGTVSDFVSVSATTYTATVTPTTSGQDVTVTVAANAAHNAAEIGNIASNTLCLIYAPVTENPTAPVTLPSSNNSSTNKFGTESTTTVNGKTVTTIAANPQKIEQKFETDGAGASIIIASTVGGSDAIVGEFNGQLVNKMAEKQAVVEIKTNYASYTIPMSKINMGAIANQFGTSTALEQIKLRIEIAKPSEEAVWLAESSAAKGGFAIVIPPIEFTVSAVYGDRTVEVSEFDTYIDRTIAIPDGLDPDRITTGIVVEPDGAVRHVPTQLVIVDGKTYVIIRSLTNSLYAVISNPVAFTDVKNHWAKNAVNDMGARTIVSGIGNGLFNPDAPITRAEFAAIIVSGLGLGLTDGESAFSDVQRSDWYNGAVHTALSYNLITGYSDGTFRPKDKITREQAMAIIARAMKITGLKPKLPLRDLAQVLDPFNDSGSISEWAKGSFADSLQAGIVKGTNAGKLNPKAYISRAEAATILQRLLQQSDLI